LIGAAIVIALAGMGCNATPLVTPQTSVRIPPAECRPLEAGEALLAELDAEQPGPAPCELIQNLEAMCHENAEARAAISRFGQKAGATHFNASPVISVYIMAGPSYGEEYAAGAVYRCP
jgi:hypothetical protein